MDYVEVLNSCRNRKARYFSVLVEGMREDITDEFFELVEEDTEWIRNIEFNGGAIGGVGKAIDELKDTISTMMLKVWCVTDLRKKHEKD